MVLRTGILIKESLLLLPRSNISGGIMNLNTQYPNSSSMNAPAPRYDYSHLDSAAPSLSYLSLLPQPSDSYAGPNTAEPPYAGPLEAITHDILTKGTSDPLDHFFTGKRQFLAKSIEEVLGLIYEREQIKYDNIRKADYDSSKLKTRLFAIDSWRTGVDPQLDRTRSQIDGELMGLEREKRLEEVACWRDITRLKSELRETLQEFNQEKRREALLGGLGSE